MKIKIFYLILVILIFVGCENQITDPKIFYDRKFAFEQNKKIGKGINLGNALEAPNEGEWGVVIKDEYFDIIKNLGFNSIRLPVKWSAHIDSQNKIDENFFNRVEYLVDLALSKGFIIILNVHHFDEIHENPDYNKQILYDIWDQVSKRFADKSTNLIFEVLNEPHNNLSIEKWNNIQKECVQIIRKNDKRKTIVVCGVNWNSVWGLDNLQIPDDENLILSIHYYEPFRFTHQGAEWISGADQWLGTSWLGSEVEETSLKADFNRAITFAKLHNIPLNCGEFGAYYKADYQSRIRWTKAVVKTCLENQISFNYWEFCAGFGIYKPADNTYLQELIDALIK